MEDVLRIGLLGGIVVLGFLALERISRAPGARPWAAAWLALYASGLLGVLDDRLPVLLHLWHLPDALFPAGLLAGALAFGGRHAPRGLLPAALGWGALRTAAALLGSPVLALGLALPLQLAGELTAALVATRATRERRAPLPARLLGPGLLVVAAVHSVDLLERSFPVELAPVVTVWLATSVAVLVLQLLALAEALHERERAGRRTLQSVIDAAPVGLLLEDAAGRVALMNRRAAEHVGGGPEGSWVGRRADRLARHLLGRVRELSPEAERARLLALRDRVAEIEDVELELDGAEPRRLRLSASPVQAGEEGRVGRVWVSRDVTEERRLEAQVQQAQRMESIGLLAGGIAHDMNNLLTPILGNAQLALDELEPGETAQEAVRAVIDATGRASDLTRQLLAFGRRQVLRVAPVDLNALVREFAPMLRRVVPETIETELALEEGLHPARADRAQVEQVLMNLVVNARDAMPEGGRLRLRTRAVPPEAGAPPPPEGQAPGAVELEVADTGQGMDERTLAHVFEPFFTTKEASRGSGLGLATVHGIAKQHGGSVHVASEPGAGTTVRVRFPRASAAGETDAAGTAPRRAAAPGARVLVVEDEPPVRSLVARILREEGHAVTEAGDAEEALRRVAEAGGPPDLLVTDVVMPGKSGPALYAELVCERPDLRVLFISGYAEGEALAGTSAGRLLPKPFSPEALRRAVGEALGAGGGGEAGPA